MQIYPAFLRYVGHTNEKLRCHIGGRFHVLTVLDMIATSLRINRVAKSCMTIEAV